MGSSETGVQLQSGPKHPQAEMHISTQGKTPQICNFQNIDSACEEKEMANLSTAENNSQAYSLSWKEFPSNLISFFRELQEEEELVDVTLACEGRQISAHKIVLAASSPFFRKLLKSNPCQHPIIILNEVRYRELAPLLHYMYYGEVNIHYDEITEFLRTARLLQVRGLTGENSPKASEATEMVPQKDKIIDSRIDRKLSKDRSPSPDARRSPLSPALKRPRITNPVTSQTGVTVDGQVASTPSPSPRSEMTPPELISSPLSCMPGGLTNLPPIPGLSLQMTMPSTIASLPQACASLPSGMSTPVHQTAPFPQFFSQNPSQQMHVGNSEDTNDTFVSDHSDDRHREDPEDDNHENCLEKMSSLANMAALKGLAGFPGPSGLASLAVGSGMVPNSDHAVGRPRFDFYRVRATDPRPCHLCGKIYKNAHTLRTHMEDKHSNCNGFRCVLCGTVAKSRNSLHSHMSRQHRGISTKDLPLLPMPAPWNPEMASKYIQLVGGVGEVVRQNYRRSDRDLPTNGRENSRDLLRDSAMGSDASTPTSQENGALSPYLKSDLEKERRNYESFSQQMEFAAYGTKPPTPSLLDTYIQMMRASGVDLMHNMNEKTWDEIRQNAALGRGVLDLTRTSGSPHDDDDDLRGSDNYSDDEGTNTKANGRDPSKLVSISGKSPLRTDVEEDSKWAVK